MKQRRQVGEGGKRREQGGEGRVQQDTIVLNSKTDNLTASED